MPDIWMDVDANLSEVPVNILPLIDDTDFKSREVAIAWNAAGMDLVWNFVTQAGGYSQIHITPTTCGDYDWAHQGDGMYSIEIPASGGASINNDTEGFGWFSGVATGVLPWRGPVIGFRAAALNNAHIDGGAVIDVNVTQVSGDSDAANNAELAFDGTGYAFTNCEIPANVTKISGTADVADILEAILTGSISSTVNDAGASSTVFITALTEASDDHYNGAFLLFVTSGNLIGQARRVSDYDGATKTITLASALTEAPANGAAFVILGRGVA